MTIVAVGISLTDLSAKILCFSYFSHFSVKKPRKRVSSLARSAVFCYAGSTLVANSVFAIGSNFCRNLYRNDKRTQASLKDVAEVFNYIFQQVMTDINSRRTPNSFVDCEFSLLGFCPKDKRFRAFHVCSKADIQGWSSEVFELANPGWCVLGDKLAFHKHLNKHKQVSHLSGQMPSIADVVRDAINDPEFPGVGGDVQIAICSKTGIDFAPIMSKTTDPKVVRKQFCGVDLDNFQKTSGGFLIGDHGEGTLWRGD